MSDVITLSSDEESPRPKRLKTVLLENTFPEISALLQAPVKPPENKPNDDDNAVIFISGASDSSKSDEFKNGDSEVVNLTDEASEVQSDSKTEKIDQSNDCVVIDDVSDGEPSGLEPDEKNNEEPSQSSSGDLNVTFTSTESPPPEPHPLLEQFLEICANSFKGSRFETKLLSKFPKIRQNCIKCKDICDDYNFKKMLMDEMAIAQVSSVKAVLGFQRIYSYLMDHVAGSSIEVPEENLAKIKKLDKTCKLLIKKIKQLGEAELDFDAEEDSTYLQMDRYTQRLSKVYKKYCELINRNPYAGRLVYEKIQFVSSKYNEINRTLTKYYRQNKFPTYNEVEKRVKKCVAATNLGLSESEIKEESKHCFVKMGELLQLRRKKELYEIMSSDVPLNEDPANEDTDLKSLLEKNLEEGDRKMKEVIDEYAKKQEANNVNLVEVCEPDSDDSNYKSTSSSDSEKV